MIQQSLASHAVNEQQSDNWEQKCRLLTEKLTNFQHQHKKIDIQIRNDLEFQRKRANQFQEKFKNAIKYKNQQEELKKILSQLNETLTNKQNQILQYIKADQQKKRKLTELDNLNQQLSRVNQQTKEQLSQIQQGAISALLEKDNIISSLQQKLIELENVDSHGLQAMIVQLQDKYKELEDKSQAEKHQMQGIIQMKDEELRDIRQKIDIQRERYEEKVALLEQQIISFEKHIQKINQQRNHEQNFEQKYYMLEEKQRKTQKKLQQFEVAYRTQKQDLIDAIQKLQTDLAGKAEQTEQLKTAQNKIKEMEKDIKAKRKQIDDSKASFEKTKGDYLKKITQLQQEKKKVQDSYDAKNSELERMRIQMEESSKQLIKTPEKKSQKKIDKDGSSLAIELQAVPALKNSSSRKESTEESAAIIEKLKSQIKGLEQNIEQLNSKLEEAMKEVQTLRQRLVSTSGSAGRSDGQAKLLVQIEDLNSYIKKVQHNLMITKLKYAEDESHWTSRQSELKKQLQKQDRKSKKEKAELIQRIDRMKKTNAKDKKTDYYQSSLK